MAKIEPGMESMLDMYIFETGSMLEQLDEILIRTEGANTFIEEDINEVFRIMHTIKGSSAMMGFDNLQKIAHKGEDLFFIIREKPELVKDAQFVYELIFTVSDLYKAEIDIIQSSPEDFEPTDFSDIISRLESAAKQLKAMEDGGAAPAAATGSGELPPESAADGAMTVRVHFEAGCGMENLRAFLLLNKIKDDAEILACVPPDVETNADTAKDIIENGFIVVFRATEVTNEDILTLIEDAVNVESYEVVNTKSEPSAPVQAEAKPEETKPESTPAPKAEKSAAQKTQEEIKKAAGSGQKQSLISVNLAKLDLLHDIVGEIITTESMVTANPDLEGLKLENFSKAARQLRKLTDELQDTVMSIRMVPLAGVFQKMGRVVRDMKVKLNKDAELILEGENTEVDKSIVDMLNDPLMHLVRNCMDHGIEDTVDERIAKGKPAKAYVKLAARNASGEVIITVSDDGAGIDKKKVLAKAQKNGMLSRPAEDYSAKEILNMILLPGFSTNEQVTEYSGRGVGMDVVKSNIEQIGGTLTVESEEGKGTSFIIKIPLTLAIVDGMKLQVGDTVLTVPISSVRESLMVNENRLLTDTESGEMIMIRGTCYPILRLHEKFKMQTDVTDLKQGILLVVKAGGKDICLFADKLIGEQPVVVKPFPKFLSRYNIKQQGLSGCTIMGDGSISLIIDVNNLINTD
ncbi:MAG: chemotaxis protein CheA [Eubacterium sp.]|nr:chemotaxis protein CheA [Eubacterium sp.]